MISIDHSPLDDRIFYKEAQSLREAGHELSMICRANPDGIMFDMGNTIPLNNSQEKMVEFSGIPTYPISSPTNFWDKSLYRILSGIFFANFIKKGIEIAADVYHAHEPVSYYIGLEIAKKTGSKVVFDSHESFTTGTPKELWIKNRHLPKLQFLISANQLTRGYLVALHPHLKSEVIYNAAQKSLFPESIRTNKPTEITIAHDGYLPFNRGLREMLDAFKIVHSKFPLIRFKIVGGTTGVEKEYLTQFIYSNSLVSNITETSWLPYTKVGNALQDCQIGLIAKMPTTNNIIGGPPIKYFNYTAAGMAIVDVGMPETTRLLNKYQNGISVSTQNAESIAQGILELLKHPELLLRYQENSKKSFLELNWETESQKLISFYSDEILRKGNLIYHL